MSAQVTSNPNRTAQAKEAANGPASGQSSTQQKEALTLLVMDLASSALSNQGAQSATPAVADGAPAPVNAQPAGQADEAGTQNPDAPAGNDQAAATRMLQDMVKQMRSENEADSKAKAAESRGDSQSAAAEPDSAGGPAGQAAPINLPQPARLQTQAGSEKSAEPLENPADLEAMHTISMHMDKMPDKMKGDDMQKMIDNKDTPPDLKAALEHVRDTPALKAKLDTAGKGGDEDGCISHKDLNKVFDDPRMKEYSKKQSENYGKNYIPSDAKQNDITPRDINANDAAREMYLYSDSLPKHIDMDTMKQFAEGKRPNDKGKVPPQVVAAAQYYTKHQEEFKKAFGGDSNNRDYAQDHLLKQVNLRPGDTKAMDTMLANEDVFFKDGEKMNREKLGAIAKDEKQKPEVREAAAQVLSDPVLYGMLDNAKDGHGTNAVKNNNDSFISKQDVEAAKSKLSETNTADAPKPTGAHKPKTAEEAEAVKDMAAGVADDPNIKDKEGGGLKEFGLKLGKIASKVLDVAKGVMDFVGGLKIPIISQIALGGAAATAAANDNGLKPALDRAENGTSVKESQEKGAALFGLDMAATAVSAVLPGAGAAVSGGAIAGVKAAASGAASAVGIGGGKAAGTAAAAGGAKAAGTEAAEAGGKAATTQAAAGGGKAAATEGAEAAGQKGFLEAVKTGASTSKAEYIALKDASASDILKAAGESTAYSQAMTTPVIEGYKGYQRGQDTKEAEALREKNIASQTPVITALNDIADDAAEKDRA